VTPPVRPETDRAIDALLGRFPQKGSALLPALYLIQEEKGFVSEESMRYVAGKVGVSPVFVAGVVTFYTMFHQKPVGRHHIQVCRTLSCALRGGAAVVEHLRKRLGVEVGGTTPDGRFSLVEVECLGACDMAPMCQINDQDHYRLDGGRLDALLEALE
jgi:NADH-quinone oxidoreductase subunit E